MSIKKWFGAKFLGKELLKAHKYVNLWRNYLQDCRVENIAALIEIEERYVMWLTKRMPATTMEEGRFLSNELRRCSSNTKAREVARKAIHERLLTYDGEEHDVQAQLVTSSLHRPITTTQRMPLDSQRSVLRPLGARSVNRILTPAFEKARRSPTLSSSKQSSGKKRTRSRTSTQNTPSSTRSSRSSSRAAKKRRTSEF